MSFLGEANSSGFSDLDAVRLIKRKGGKLDVEAREGRLPFVFSCPLRRKMGGMKKSEELREVPR